MTDKSSKSSIKTANTSVISQKKSKFLELFGWCCQQDSVHELKYKQTPIPFPSTVIDLEKPLLQSIISPADSLKPINLQAELIIAPVPKVYPIDRVFILGDSYKLVAKVTKKPILAHGIPQMPSFGTLSKEYKRQRSLEEIDSREVSTMIKKEIFSKYEKGIKAAEWYQITPEKIAVHIARRLQCGIMVDALCGFGGDTIQFAKYCDYVLGIDIDPTKTFDARHNAKIYGVDHKIDFITVDFLKLKNLMGDIVYLAPSDTRQSADEPFSIFKHTDPDLRQLLAKSLDISHSIAIKLPEDTDIEELAQLFQVSLEQYRSYSRRFCVEIERIVNSNDETECVVVYFGDCSSISLSEEHEAIYEYLAEKETSEWRTKYPLHIVLTIVRSIGARKFLHYVSKAEEELSKKEKGTISVFEVLLDKLVEDGIFSQHSLKKLLEEASLSIKLRLSLSKKRSQRSRTRANKLSSAATTDLTSEATTQLESRMKMSAKFSEFLLGSHKEDEQDLRESFDDNAPYLIPTNYNPELGQIIINSSDDNEDEDDDDNYSALSVSSYSVSSDYLKDNDESDMISEKETRRSRKLIDISFEESDRANSLPKNESLSKNDYMRKPALKGIFRGGSTPNIAFMSDKSDKENITPKKTVRFGLKVTK